MAEKEIFLHFIATRWLFLGQRYFTEQEKGAFLANLVFTLLT